MSSQCLHCLLLHNVLLTFGRKHQPTTPKTKWTRPIDKSGKFHLALTSFRFCSNLCLACLFGSIYLVCKMTFSKNAIYGFNRGRTVFCRCSRPETCCTFYLFFMIDSIRQSLLFSSVISPFIFWRLRFFRSHRTWLYYLFSHLLICTRLLNYAFMFISLSASYLLEYLVCLWYLLLSVSWYFLILFDGSVAYHWYYWFILFCFCLLFVYGWPMDITNI